MIIINKFEPKYTHNDKSRLISNSFSIIISSDVTNQITKMLYSIKKKFFFTLSHKTSSV